VRLIEEIFGSRNTSEEFLTDRTNKDRVANAVFNRRQQGAWVMVSEIRAKSRVLLVQLYV